MERWLGELGEGTGDSGGQARLLPPPYEVREAWAAGMSPPQAAFTVMLGPGLAAHLGGGGEGGPRSFRPPFRPCPATRACSNLTLALPFLPPAFALALPPPECLTVSL